MPPLPKNGGHRYQLAPSRDQKARTPEPGLLCAEEGDRSSRQIRIRRWRLLRTMHVLVVEDHQDSREQLQRWLTRRDYDVATAGDLQTAIDFLEKEPFDAIIADISLPDGTGYALISEARRRGIRALGIAVSGYPYPPDVDEAGATGFHYHLTKPVDCDHLCSLLKESRASEGDASTPV